MATLRTYNATVASFSPLLHLRLSEDSGTTAFDSADDFDGEYRDGFALGADGPIGNGAVDLDGSTGYVFVPHQDQLLLDSGSIEVWFTADTVTGDHNLFAKNSAGFGTGGQVALSVRDGNAFAALGDLATNHVVVGDDPDDAKVEAGVSAQMVFTFGAEGMALYLNGELVDTNPYTGGLAGNFEPLVLGAENGRNESGTPIDLPGDLFRFFDGAIDEFVIYDEALSEAQVQQLFQAGQQGLQLAGTADADTLIGGLDDETLIGRGGNDNLRGAGGDDALLGGSGGDELRGGPGADELDGMGGADLVLGGGGDDQLFGGRGVDVLRGHAGDDLLNGGPGRDRLIGGPGSDTYQIDQIDHGPDDIRGFAAGPGGDILDLSAVLDFGADDAPDAFVRLTEAGNGTTVEVNGDGAGDDFTAVFNLAGVVGLDLGTLLADGNVQLSPPES